jgi:hypothetical protein
MVTTKVHAAHDKKIKSWKNNSRDSLEGKCEDSSNLKRSSASFHDDNSNSEQPTARRSSQIPDNVDKLMAQSLGKDAVENEGGFDPGITVHDHIGTGIDQWQYWKQGLIHPNSSFKQMWDLFTTYFVVYTAFVLPFRIGFSMEAEGSIIYKDAIMDWTFILDFFMCFVTGYEHRGRIIFDRWKIAKNYATGWMILDFVSSFPIEYIIPAENPEDVSTQRSAKLVRITRIMKIVRLVRLARASRMGRIFSRYELKVDVNHGAMVCIKFIMGVLVVAHWIGCFWFMIPQMMEFPTDSWVWGYTNDKGLPLHQQPVGNQYLTCFYWSITTMTTIGYGDISPANQAEKAFCIVCMLLGAGIFAFGITTMCDIIAHMDLRGCAYRDAMDNIDAYLKYRECPKELKIRIRTFIHFQKASRTGCFFEENEIFSPMGPTLRREVQQHTYLSLLRSFGIFLPSSVISDGCHGRAILEEAINRDGFVGCVMSPGEILYHANEFSKGLYFVLEGSVVFSFAKHVVMSLGEQAVVGVGATFSRSLVTAQAAAMCDTYVLKRDIVKELCAEFPVFKSRIRAQSRVTLVFAVTTISKVKQYFRRWIDVSFGMGTWMKGKKSRGRTSHRSSVSLAAVAPPPDEKAAGAVRADALPPVAETTESNTSRLGPSVAAEEMLQRLHDRLDEHDKLLRGDGGVMAKLDQLLKAIGTGTTEVGVADGKLKLVPLV